MYMQCVNMFVWCRYMWVDILGLHVNTCMDMCSACMCIHIGCFMLKGIVITPCEIYTMCLCLCSCILCAHPCLHTCMFMRMCVSYGLDRSSVPPIT